MLQNGLERIIYGENVGTEGARKSETSQLLVYSPLQLSQSLKLLSCVTFVNVTFTVSAG